MMSKCTERSYNNGLIILYYTQALLSFSLKNIEELGYEANYKLLQLFILKIMLFKCQSKVLVTRKNSDSFECASKVTYTHC